MNDFYLIGKNLLRRKIRTLLLLVAIFVAFLIYSILTTFEKAMNSGIELSASDRLVVVNKINFTQPMPLAYVNRVVNIDGVKTVTHSVWFGGYFQEPRNFIMAFTVDPQTWLDVYPELIVSNSEKVAFNSERACAVVGESLANTRNWKVGDRIVIGSSIYTHINGGHSWDFTICGIFRGNKKQIDTNYMVFQYEYLNQTRNFGKDTTGWLVLRTNNSAINDKVSETIDNMFANSPFETRTSTESAFQKAFIEQVGNISLIVSTVVSSAFITILMIVGNTMFLAIRERTKEIAVLKTLGFQSKRIFKLILGESIFLSLLGGIPAILASIFLIKMLANVLATTFPSLALSSGVIFSAVLWMIILGLITGFIPAYNAMQLNIQKALGRS